MPTIIIQEFPCGYSVYCEYGWNTLFAKFSDKDGCPIHGKKCFKQLKRRV